METLSATYRLSGHADVEQYAREIAVEQSVEVPESLIAERRISEEVVGRVGEIRQVDDASFDVRIDYNAELTAGQIAQTLNLVYGNVSLKSRVRLTDLEFPASYLRTFRGPKFGGSGLRELLGVFGRPLVATALKPRGLPDKDLAALARSFAAGGGDIVKDDHNLVDASFDAFRRRVELCQQAVIDGSAASDKRTLYFPNISTPAQDIEQHVEFVVRQGIPGILVSPLVIGMDFVRHLAESYPLAFMAHPTFAGAFFHDPEHGIDPGLLLGTLFRLIGCDCSIFPNQGGRFTFSEETCQSIRERLVSPLGALSPALPTPAGGMSFETVPSMASQYGADAVFLIGGALLGRSADLRESTAELLARIREHFPNSRSAAPKEFASACELPLDGAAPAGRGREPVLLPFRPDFQWEGRPAAAYKEQSELPFREVRRVELIGKSGEQTAFDVRYFEIGPAGHSSLERHAHTHVVIGARGEGILQCGEKQLYLRPFDVAYVPPLAVHQLRNEGESPFGFFCIVDHDRDRPQPP